MTVDEPEFSRFLPVDDIPHSGLRRRLKADDSERLALALRFGLVALDTLEGSLMLQLLAGGPMVRVTGAGTAAIVQKCVVTGEPVPDALQFDIQADFVPPDRERLDLELSLSDADPPESFVAGGIDLGELLAQNLALAMNPYPRRAGADLGKLLGEVARSDEIEVGGAERSSPFAVLSRLKGADTSS